ncbi:hypothetical protein B0H19DRAFT_976114, partial [Mycena capillaripes]
MKYTRVDDLWFTDGTMVVLKAEDKIFHVPKWLLAARSSVFRHMFEFPQPTNDEVEIIEGSPVVTLYDTADAAEAFLRALLDSSYFMPPPALVELQALLGILRLSNKYDVQYLYLRALEHLSKYGPCSLHHLRSRTVQNFDDTPLRHLLVISAVKKVGALWLLPGLY